MRTAKLSLLLAGISGCLVGAQPDSPGRVTRTLHFTHIDSAQSMQEIATLIRSIAEIRDASIKPDARVLEITGNAEQVSLAEWLLAQTDAPLPHSEPADVHEFRMAGTKENVVHVYYLRHADTIEQLQEMTTLVRAIGEIRRALTYNAAKVVTLRGTADEIALADWLFSQLDVAPSESQNAKQVRSSQDFRFSGSADDVTRVFFIDYAETVQQLQEAATLVRSIGEIRRVFTHNQLRALALRGTPDQIDLAQWLLARLEPPRTGSVARTASERSQPEYAMKSSPEDVVRVFFLPPSESVQTLQEKAVQIRMKTKAPRLFTFNSERAIAVRASATQMEDVSQAFQASN